MEIPPVVAPGITIATRVVPSLDTAIAETPPIVKKVGLLKFVPEMVTKVPTAPLDGVKELMEGCAKVIVARLIAIKNVKLFFKKLA